MRRHTPLWILVLVLTGLVAAAALAASATRPTAKPTPSGAFSRRVDVGGYRLAVYCRGRGSPTVVLESGAGSSSASWSGVEPKIAKSTRVCSYDRAGLGNSDARRPATPKTVPAGQVVKELHALLRGAGIRPPYVLGGSDLGGFFNRLYAEQHPAEVVGLVSLDGWPIGLPGEPFLNEPTKLGLPPQAVVGAVSDSYLATGAARELAKRPTLGTRPFIVLVAGRGTRGPPDQLKWQKQLARLSASSMLVRADLAPARAIHIYAAELTGEAFRLVIAAVRRGPLPRCRATRLSRDLWGTCLDTAIREIGG
jgi:pimeloyl-ACP methyl ester carboxylesterase